VNSGLENSNKEITKAVFLINLLGPKKKEQLITKACIEVLKKEDKDYSQYNIQAFISNSVQL